MTLAEKLKHGAGLEPYLCEAGFFVSQQDFRKILALYKAAEEWSTATQCVPMLSPLGEREYKAFVKTEHALQAMEAQK